MDPSANFTAGSDPRSRVWSIYTFDLAFAIKNIDLIIKTILNNLYNHLFTIGSPKLIPIIFIPFAGIGMYFLNKNKSLFIYCLSYATFLPYIFSIMKILKCLGCLHHSYH